MVVALIAALSYFENMMDSHSSRSRFLKMNQHAGSSHQPRGRKAVMLDVPFGEVSRSQRVHGDDRTRRSAPSFSWYRRYRALLWVTDAIMIALGLLIAFMTRFGDDFSATITGSSTAYSVGIVLMALTWWTVLDLRGSRERQIAGHGIEEYRRVISGTLYSFGGFAIAAFIFNVQPSRAVFLVLLPLGTLLLLLGRWLVRQELHHRRATGRALMPTLVVGGGQEVSDAIEDLERNLQTGYRPVAVALSDQAETGTPKDLNRFLHTRLESIDHFVHEHRVAAVVVAGGIHRRAVRSLAWKLENSPVELMFVPWLTDVAGPRLSIRQVQDLSLTHVELPTHSGWNHVLKRGFDIIFALMALSALAPVLGILAIMIKLEDGGPVLFKQERIGMGGEPFRIFKFRSMHIDAERRLAALLSHNDSGGPLFKMKGDPRITKIGRFLRKYSLDELPQFCNVLGGSMSVVGPRPHLAHELAEYPEEGLRRLLIKPGVTGLWQVSGRSDLSFEDSVRLDLRYVENWSLTGDITIVLKTVRTILRPDGAY